MQEDNKQLSGLSASEEMISLLGLDKPAKDTTVPVSEATSQATAPSSSVIQEQVPTAPSTVISTEPLPFQRADVALDYEELSPKHWLQSAKGSLLAVVPYVLIFVIGVAGYYFFFADPSNRPQLFKRDTVETAQSPLFLKAQAMEDMKVAQKDQYETWIKSFYFDISDTAILEPDRVAPNKLTNFENYLLGINPRTNDIRHTGQPDARYILNGVDPNTGLPLKDWQKDVLAQYFDLSKIEERLTGSPKVFGATSAGGVVTPRGPARTDFNNQTQEVNSAVPTSVVAETVTPSRQNTTSTQVLSASGAAAPAVASALNDSCEENRLQINTSIPGRLEIPTINVNVPIIWTDSPADFNEDLKTGVVHYPCTPLPGDVGKSYISGHSSNYTWAGGDYNKVFTRMNELEAGMTFKITVVGADGKDIRLFYVIQSKQEYEADDQAQFLNTAYSEVALSTCWPINTTKRRLVTVARLDRIER